MYADISDFYLIKKRITCTFHDIAVYLLYVWFILFISTWLNIDFIKKNRALYILYICIILTFFQESYTYKDPITEFVECLYVNFDFDSAQKKLRECESVSNLFSNLTNIHFNLLLRSSWSLLFLYDKTEVF